MHGIVNLANKHQKSQPTLRKYRIALKRACIAFFKVPLVSLTHSLGEWSGLEHMNRLSYFCLESQMCVPCLELICVPELLPLFVSYFCFCLVVFLYFCWILVNLCCTCFQYFIFYAKFTVCNCHGVFSVNVTEI